MPLHWVCQRKQIQIGSQRQALALGKTIAFFICNNFIVTQVRLFLGEISILFLDKYMVPQKGPLRHGRMERAWAGRSLGCVEDIPAWARERPDFNKDTPQTTDGATVGFHNTKAFTLPSPIISCVWTQKAVPCICHSVSPRTPNSWGFRSQDSLFSLYH